MCFAPSLSCRTFPRERGKPCTRPPLWMGVPPAEAPASAGMTEFRALAIGGCVWRVRLVNLTYLTRWIPACAGMTVVGCAGMTGFRWDDGFTLTLALSRLGRGDVAVGGRFETCPYGHPPSPLTMKRRGRFLAALGMTEVALGMTEVVLGMRRGARE